MTRSSLAFQLVLPAFLMLPSLAYAGIDECDGIRIEADAHCEVEFSCSAGCTADVYRKNCATQLFQSCQQECETPPTVECTGECGTFCDSQCAQGLDVVCQHNCFPECVDNCEMSCASDVDPERCRASCEATCDGECTMQCADLPPDTSCIKHCEECCTGSCRAIAGMNCQISCQEVEFEVCETHVDVECKAGCEGSGALFCDGQFIAGPEKLVQCAKGLAARGIETLGYDVNLEAQLDANISVEDLQSANDKAADVAADVESTAEQGANAGCTVTGNTPGNPSTLSWLWLLAASVGLRRRRN